jgi:hypothetical protein
MSEVRQRQDSWLSWKGRIQSAGAQGDMRPHDMCSLPDTGKTSMRDSFAKATSLQNRFGIAGKGDAVRPFGCYLIIRPP